MDLRTERAYWKRRTSPPDRRFGWRVSDQVALYQLRLGFHTGLETRNKMHIHGSDQVLFVTAGKVIIATEARQEVISVGDVAHSGGRETLAWGHA
jgi:mannose-6-phosphate isomerase-like protein (cupin superfamily)